MSESPPRVTRPSAHHVASNMLDLKTAINDRYHANDDALIGFYKRADRGFVTRSHRELLEDVFRTARSLQADGLEAGEFAIIAGSSPEHVVQHFLASICVGAVPVIMAARPAFDDPATSNQRCDQILTSLPGKPAIVIPQNSTAPEHTVQARVMRIPNDLSKFLSGPLDVMAPNPGDIAYLQLSSGSTAAPKPIALSHASVISNIQSLIGRLEAEPADIFASWLPLYHDMGLVALLLQPPLLGSDFYLMAPFDFLADPSLWLRTMSNLRVTRACTPPFGLHQVVSRVSEKRLSGLDLTSVKSIYTGAEPIDGQAIRSFYEKLAPLGLGSNVVKPCYGMAETTLMLTMVDMNTGLDSGVVDALMITALEDVRFTRTGSTLIDPSTTDDELEIASVGYPGADVELWLVNDDGKTIFSDRTCGEIVVRTGSLGAGYLQPDGSVDTFNRDAFHTGDVGFLSEGNLYVVERKRNIIIRQGQNISAQAIEATLASITGYSRDQLLVVDSDIATGRGRITAMVELDRKADPGPVTASILASLDRFSPPLDDLILLRPGAIPRTTSGKKRHIETRRMLTEGSLRIVELHEVNPSATPRPQGQPTAIIDLVSHETADAVRDVVGAFARLRGSTAAITGATSFAGDLGLDSLAMYELAMAVEEKTKVELRESDLAIARTVADLSAICISRRREGAHTGSSITSAIHAAAEPPPQALNNVTAQKGRQVEIDGRWVTDFASCNYLGLDLHPDVMASIDPMVRQWGTHPSWTRVVASPAPYRELETRLAALIGVTDTVIFPTVTLLHMGVLPTLAGPDGVIFVDTSAHQSLQQAADLAKSGGSAVSRFAHNDLTQLEASLNLYGGGKNRIIAVDGIYSMSGSTGRLRETIELAKRFDATVYVDDAHGFGVIGEKPTKETPLGFRGNGVIKHLGLDYENVVYVAGLSKAYSSMGAFVSAESPTQRRIYENASTLIFGGPIPVASLATAIAGLDVSAVEGDAIRHRLWGLSKQLITGVRSLGLPGDNGGDFPIVNVEIGSVSDTLSAAHTLWDDGLLITPSMFPAMPLDRGGVRFTLTAANTEQEVAAALRTLAKLSQAKLVAV